MSSLIELGVSIGECESTVETPALSYLDPLFEEVETVGEDGQIYTSKNITHVGRLMNEIIVSHHNTAAVRGEIPGLQHSMTQELYDKAIQKKEECMQQLGFPEDEGERLSIISESNLVLDSAGFRFHKSENRLDTRSDDELGVRV